MGEELLEKEVLSREDMISLAGPRPFAQTTTYDEFLDASVAPEKRQGEEGKEEGEGEKEGGKDEK